MSFSQGWDAGFRAILIYVGIVFFWLGLVEPYFAERSLSVTVMNVVALAAAVGFVALARRRAIAEKARADAEVAALMQEQA